MTETIDAPSIRASLVLRDFGDDPHRVTELLGLQPSRSGRAGDPLLGPSGQPTTRIVRRTYWALQSRLAPSALMSEHVNDIVEQVRDAARRFAGLSAGTTMKLLCTIIPDGDLPILTIESESLRTLGEIGIDLEIDIISVDGPDDS